MKSKIIQILLGIIIVIVVSAVAIVFCTKVLNKNYVYKILYYSGENLYVFNITEEYDLKIDIKVICTEEKCRGNYENTISTTNGASKEDVKKLVEIFNLNKQESIETNEEKVTEEQKIVINKIIN